MRICTFVKELDSAMALGTSSTAQDCVCLAVRQAARHVTQLYDRFLAPSGLRTTQFSLLAKLQRQGPMTINALATDMVMDRTTLGRNILPLERDGLIWIEPAASDRRSKELHLTKRGEKRLETASKGWAEAQARFESTFGGTRSSNLRALLREVAATEFAPEDAGT
jgi:DNA-binding MarR family transcriptional regulator